MIKNAAQDIFLVLVVTYPDTLSLTGQQVIWHNRYAVYHDTLTGMSHIM